MERGGVKGFFAEKLLFCGFMPIKRKLQQFLAYIVYNVSTLKKPGKM